MDELGLTEYLADFDTTAGPVESVTDMLRKLEKLGVSTFIAALPGHAAPLDTIKSLAARSEEHTSELQSLMRISYAVFCLNKKKNIRYDQLTLNINERHQKDIHKYI